MRHKVDPELTLDGRRTMLRHMQFVSDAEADALWRRLVQLQGATLAKGDEVRFVDGKIEVDHA